MEMGPALSVTMSASAPRPRPPSGLRQASAQELLAAFRVDAEEFLRLFIAGLQTQPTREDTLQALGNAAEALRGIRIGADFLQLQAVSALCRQGEQDLLQQLPLVASGAALQWETLQAVIDGLRQHLLPEQAEPPAAPAASEPTPLQPPAEAKPRSETQPEPEPEPEPEPVAPMRFAPPQVFDPAPAPIAPAEPTPQTPLDEAQTLTVQTAVVGPWIVAVPAALAPWVLEPGTPQWTGPDGQLLLLQDDVALPALDLPACWLAPEPQHEASGAALLLQPDSGEPPFALRVQALGRQQDLLFWPVPPAVQSACGVRAAAWEGAPWQPDTGQPVLLLDLPWLEARLRVGSDR
ncbi:MAG: histidine kinase [Thiomonas arsenitoxydans]|uniref:Histidine kinase n=2 Tax=Burkholderiales genera incertae sedis TaxID=224471 RepID=A0A8I1MYC2_THIA3|nr:histidine kinase [Thiomonas arsenitoxydans]ODU96165.1 MAG: histidine kinase [Thiomonas sp. SCN 64-16]